MDLHKTWSSLDKQSSITETVISQVLQWIGNMNHELMQLNEGAKGEFPAARNTNVPSIPATRIGTKPWSLFGEESEAQLLANFTEYAAERYSGHSATRKEISLWSALRLWEATLLHS